MLIPITHIYTCCVFRIIVNFRAKIVQFILVSHGCGVGFLDACHRFAGNHVFWDLLVKSVVFENELNVHCYNMNCEV
jgi:hypothetical protein